MTIIIKVPQPDTEWRLVLVTRNTVIHATYGRDATPADLERAGYVLRGGRQDLDCAISDLTAQVREADGVSRGAGFAQLRGTAFGQGLRLAALAGVGNPYALIYRLGDGVRPLAVAALCAETQISQGNQARANLTRRL